MTTFRKEMAKIAHNFLNAYPKGDNQDANYLAFINPNYTDIEGFTMTVTGRIGLLNPHKNVNQTIVSINYHVLIINQETDEVEVDSTWYDHPLVIDVEASFFDAKFQIEDLIDDWNWE